MMDLSLIPTEDLLEAVANRCESVVVYGHLGDLPDGEESSYCSVIKGDAKELLMICEVVKRQVLQEFLQTGRAPNSWEEW